MTSPLTDARLDIVAQLETLYPGRKVYGYVPPSPVIPCAIVAPDEQQLEVAGFSRWNYRLRVTVISAAQTTTPAAIAALEDDLTDLIGWAGETAYDLNIGPASYGDATVLAAGLSLTYPVTIPTTA